MKIESADHVYALIMAGGFGKKLWPVSRRKLPKQFIDLLDDGTMLAKTVSRISRVVKQENIIIITGGQGLQHISSILPDFPHSNIIVEPASRNTAPCIALATAHIRKRDPEAVTVVLPSDHLVLDEDAFRDIVHAAILVAREKHCLVTLGIKPDRAETAYGYIQADVQEPLPETFSASHAVQLFRVKAFAEKPDFATATIFLESQDFFWNSGVFVWHVEAILNEFERSMPDLFKDLISIFDNLGTDQEEKVITDVYSWIHPHSIDYGIMEKADSVYVLVGEFGWSDLGCWDEVQKLAESRGISVLQQSDSKLVQIETENVFIKNSAGKKMICTIGVEDIIIVETDDALLVCKKGMSHRVREVADILRREDLDTYL